MANVTFFTTDPTLHKPFFYTVARRLVEHQLCPVFLIIQNRDLYGRAYDFNKVFLEHIHQNVFYILNPVAHIQMQDTDKLHAEIQDNARFHGAKTFVIQHGLVATTPEYIAKDPDYLFAWSVSQAKQIATCFPSERIVVTGSPKYDTVPVHGHRAFEKVIITTRPLSTTNGPTADLTKEQSESHFTRILEVVEAFPSIKFLIKLHPSSYETPSFYNSLIERTGKPFANLGYVDPLTSLIVHLRDASCLISYPNTSALCDASSIGIPTIDVGYISDLTDEMNRIMRGEKQRTYDYGDIPRDKRAGERIADFVAGKVSCSN